MAGRSMGHRPKGSEVHKRELKSMTMVDPLLATNTTCCVVGPRKAAHDLDKRVIYQNADMVGEMFCGQTKRQQEETRMKKKKDAEELRLMRAVEKGKKLDQLEVLRKEESRAPQDTGVLKADVAEELGSDPGGEEEEVPDDWDDGL